VLPRTTLRERSAVRHNAKTDYGNRVVEFDQLVGTDRNG
jgi:hypothetical protein